MTWHVDAALLGAYVAGTTDGVVSTSIEQHVLRCSTCRAELGAAPPVVGLDAVWDRVRDEIEVPAPTLVERAARRLRVPSSDARLLAATPSLTPSWFAGLAAVVGLALVAATYGRGESVALFLLVAPLLPLLGVAASFDPTLDPSHEVAWVTPYPTLRLLLLRAMRSVWPHPCRWWLSRRRCCRPRRGSRSAGCFRPWRSRLSCSRCPRGFRWRTPRRRSRRSGPGRSLPRPSAMTWSLSWHRCSNRCTCPSPWLQLCC